jgi:glycosyltransferase involved in cell wall biosynthesis
MRIAFLSTFYPFRGGIAQFNASLYREFGKNHEIKAFTFTRQYPDFLFPGKTQMVTNDEKADAIPSVQKLDSINPFTYLSTARAIKQYAPDLLIMKYWMSFFGPSLGTVAKLMPEKTKVITVLDNVIPHEKRFFDVPFTRYFLNQNDGFVAMSETVKDDLLTFLPNAKLIKREHPLYNHFGSKPLKSEARKQLAIHPDKKTLLFFGFIRDYKGLDILIDAFETLDNSYQLVIAGEPYGSFDKYSQQISRLTHKENVHVFNDYISDEQVPLFFSAADICVLPYKSATQSGITSIAYHFNVPLIATDVGGLKESIHHMKTGIIVDKPTPELTSAAINLYFNEQLQTKFNAEIERLKKELSWESFANAIIDLYNTL